MASPSSMVLRKLPQFDAPDFQDRLCDTLKGDEYLRCAQNIEGNDLGWLVDYLDGALGHLDPSDSAFRACSRELQSICGTRAMLPASYARLSQLLTIDSLPSARGDCGDVYEGTLDGSKFCVKRVRVYENILQKAEKTFYEEAVVWKRLSHKNIVPLLSITTAPLQFISDWMPGGTLPEHITKNPDADRLLLLSDVVNGLCYLHSLDVIHGNLKGSNVLVDAAGRARITDFYLATLITDVDSDLNTLVRRCCTQRWTAPEVLDGEKHSKEADIFSLAMVMVEIFTHAKPFDDLTSVMAMTAIVEGERPPRPTHPAFIGTLWTLMQRCWDSDPSLRPKASEVLQALATPYIPVWKWMAGCLSQWVRIFLKSVRLWS